MHATLCDLIMDLVQNAVEANATVIELTLAQTEDRFGFVIQDNGIGMDRETQAKATDPFYSDGQKHAHRRVGLGLPFLLQTADAVSGRAAILSEKGKGTRIEFSADAQHVDLPPVGDVPASMAMMLSQPFQGELRMIRRTESDSYWLSRGELTDTLGDLNDTENLKLIKHYIELQEENLNKAGTSYE